MNIEVENSKANEAELKTRMEDNQALVASLRDQLKALIEKNRALETKPRVEYIDRTDEGALKELTKQVAVLNEDKVKYQQLVARIEVALQAKDEKLKNVETEFEENQQFHQNEMDSLQQALSERNAIIDRILNLQKEQERELSALKEKLSTAERGLLDGEHFNRVDTHKIEQLQAEKDRYLDDLQHAEKRYKELQDQLTDQQHNIQDFFTKESREKERKIQALQSDIEELQNKNKRRMDEMAREMEKQLEIQRTTLINELSKNESSKEVFWNKEREMLKSQIENMSTRLLEQENLVMKLKNEGTSQQQKEVELENLRYMNSNLKSEVSDLKSALNDIKLQHNEIFKRLEDKNTEIKELVIIKEKHESSKDEQCKLRSELNRRGDELVQFNNELITLKDRIKNLLKKIDEVSNEKLFYEAKVERLESKLIDVLYSEEKTKPRLDESQQLKEDIHSKLNRTEGPE